MTYRLPVVFQESDEIEDGYCKQKRYARRRLGGYGNSVVSLGGMLELRANQILNREIERAQIRAQASIATSAAGFRIKGGPSLNTVTASQSRIRLNQTRTIRTIRGGTGSTFRISPQPGQRTPQPVQTGGQRFQGFVNPTPGQVQQTTRTLDITNPSSLEGTF